MSGKRKVRELQIRREGRKTTKVTRELDRGLNRDLQYYLGKNYPILIYPAEEEGYVAEIEELPGCITQGETLEEVSDRINNARQLWIEQAYEDGLEIPLPRTEEEYSGRFIVRLPKYLHRRLSEQATREKISLNQYVLSLLSSAASSNERATDQTLSSVDELCRLLREYLGAECDFEVSYRVGTWDLVSEEILPSKPVTTRSTLRELSAA